MKIGVFDSGIGGLSVAHAITVAMPHYQVIFKNDSQHVPYGTRPVAEVLSFVTPILQTLIDDGCAVIVIACNTVSTTLITQLRRQFSIPLIGMEPMIKPAALLTKTGIIAVCATPATLGSHRYQWLKQHYAASVTVIEPDCSNWSTMIERQTLDVALITKQITDVIADGADVIVLGCTHYHWIEVQIQQIAADRAQVIQPELAIISRLKTVISQLD